MEHLLAHSEIPYSRECSSGDHLFSSFPQETHTDLPSSLRFLGPYLSMMMPRGRVMALSRKEPTVNAKFRISSWALQLSQPFTRLTSSSSGSAVLPTVPLVTFSVCTKKEDMVGIREDPRDRCSFRIMPLRKPKLVLRALRLRQLTRHGSAAQTPAAIMQVFTTFVESQSSQRIQFKKP